MGKQRMAFLRESIRDIRATGSVAPSSRFLCRAVARQINPEKARVVVELGPGDGVITRYILQRMAPQARLVIMEINPVFIEKIKRDINDPRMTIIHDSAENMGEHLQKLGITEVDYFVSGIPFTILPETLADNILKECQAWLADEGIFLQFHYSPLMLWRYRRIFDRVDVKLVPFNIPPALLISCTK